ncbi:MAG: AAA family ATPase [Candidatus Eremiobacteraeota bacterium]|nr:AAA family ATPase [Candidatus Eremiobacteraeota bacterium]
MAVQSHKIPLVGRQNEILVLRHAALEAKRGHGSIVGLSGEAGIGKTRLALHVLGSERHTSTCLTGRAFATEGRAPFAMWIDAVEPFLADRSPESLRTLIGPHAVLRRLFPHLTVALGAAGDVKLAFESSEQAKMLFLVAFRDLLRRTAAERPVVLYLDDAHAADGASLELLHFVARGIGSLPILILLTFRDTQPLEAAFASWLDSLRSNELINEVKLQPLDYAETEDFVRNATGVYVSPSMVSALYERTAGNPLFLHELLRSNLPAGGVPRSIAQLVRSRLSSIGADAQAVLNVAAVAGESTSLALLQNVAGLQQRELIAALDELLYSQFLSEHAEKSSLRYAFAHPLIREVVYEELSVARRASLHDTLGRILQSGEYVDSTDPAELAHHLSRSLRPETRRLSLPHLVNAASRALAVFANRDAVDALERAVELLAPDDACDLRFEVFGKLGKARERSGRFEAAIAAYGEALTFAASNESAAALHRRSGRCYWHVGDEARAIAHFEAGLQSLDGSDASIEAVNLLQELAQTRQRLGLAEQSIDDNLRSVNLAEQLKQPQLTVRGFVGLLTSYAVVGDMDIFETYAERALELCGTLSMTPIAWQVHATIGALVRHRGAHARAAEHLHESLSIADALGAPALESWPLSVLSDQCRMAGDLANALRFGERAVEIDRLYAQHGLLPRSLAYAAVAHRLLGNREAASAYIGEALELLRLLKKQEIRIGTAVLGADAFLSFADGQAEEALCKVEALVAHLDERGEPALYLLYPFALPLQIETALRSTPGTPEAALERLRALSLRWKHEPAQAAYEHLAALATLKRGAAEARAFDESLRRYRSLGLRYDVARILLDKAELLASLHQRHGAIAALQEGMQFARDIRAVDLQERFARAQRQAGLRPASFRRSTGKLTERELEVAELASRGATNKQVAAELGISVLTVETHVRNILQKSGLQSRAQLGEHLA